MLLSNGSWSGQCRGSRAAGQAGAHDTGAGPFRWPLTGGGRDHDIGCLVPSLVGLRLLDIAGPERDFQGPQEREKGVVEPDQRPVPLDGRSEHVVVHQVLLRAADKTKSVQDGTIKGLLSLGMFSPGLLTHGVRLVNRMGLRWDLASPHILHRSSRKV